MSMSALPTADDGWSQVVGSKVNTLPRGATISDNYTVMQVCVSEECDCGECVMMCALLSEDRG